LCSSAAETFVIDLGETKRNAPGPARWWFYPLLLGLTALLCLFVAETAVRLVWSAEHPKRPRTYTFNAETGLVSLPGAYRLPFARCLAEKPDCERVQVKYTINADGFRGPEWRQPTGKPLIVVMGDSQIEGQQVDDEQLATAQLEKLLKPQAPDVEVRNVAIHSAGFVHYYQMWRKFVAATKPDELIVAAVGANDFRNCSTKLETFHAMRPHYTQDAQGQRQAHFEPAPQANVSNFRRSLSNLYERLELVRFMRWRGAVKEEEARAIGDEELPPDLQIYENPPAPDYAEAAALGREYLARLIREAKAQGTRVTVVALPWRDEALDENWQRIAAAYQKTGRAARLERARPETLICQTARENGVGCISFADYVRKLPLEKQRTLWHLKLDLHLTEEGQRALAEAVSRDKL
jgi:lysophospholipase L1-like esterase